MVHSRPIPAYAAAPRYPAQRFFRVGWNPDERARIAELEGQHGRADYWFARAIDGQKSIPFAYSYWGEALLDRGDADPSSRGQPEHRPVLTVSTVARAAESGSEI